MKAVPYILGISQGVVKEMAGYSHTLPCCVSQPRSSLEASKKQLRIWIEYACGVAELFLYLSFAARLVLLWSPYGDSDMARNGFEDGSKWCATGNACSNVNEASFISPRTYVHGKMNLCSFFDTMI